MTHTSTGSCTKGPTGPRLHTWPKLPELLYITDAAAAPAELPRSIGSVPCIHAQVRGAPLRFAGQQFAKGLPPRTFCPSPRLGTGSTSTAFIPATQPALHPHNSSRTTDVDDPLTRLASIPTTPQNHTPTSPRPCPRDCRLQWVWKVAFAAIQSNQPCLQVSAVDDLPTLIGALINEASRNQHRKLCQRNEPPSCLQWLSGTLVLATTLPTNLRSGCLCHASCYPTRGSQKHLGIRFYARQKLSASGLITMQEARERCPNLGLTRPNKPPWQTQA